MLLRLLSAIALTVASRASSATLPSSSSIQQLNTSLLELKYAIFHRVSLARKSADTYLSPNIDVPTSNSGPLLAPKIDIRFPRTSDPSTDFEPRLVAPLFT